MDHSTGKTALFAGLVFNQNGEPAETTTLGGEPFYVILDGDFRRHVEAEAVDRQVLDWLREQILMNKKVVTQGAMSMLGQEDLFTKARVNASFENLDEQMAQLMKEGLPEEVRAWLGMLGFRVVLDVHGEVVEVNAASVADADDW